MSHESDRMAWMNTRILLVFIFWLKENSYINYFIYLFFLIINSILRHCFKRKRFFSLKNKNNKFQREKKGKKKERKNKENAAFFRKS